MATNTWSNRLTLISLVPNTSRECCLDNLEASSGDHQSISTTTVKGLNIRTQVPTDISTLIRGVLLSDCEDVPSPAPPSTCHSRSKRLFAHTAGVFFYPFSCLFCCLHSLCAALQRNWKWEQALILHIWHIPSHWISSQSSLIPSGMATVGVADFNSFSLAFFPPYLCGVSW